MSQFVVRLFAGAAAIAGTHKAEIVLNIAQDRATIREIAEALVAKHPDLAKLAVSSRWAIDDQFVSEDKLVSVENDLALIPPVSGG